MASEQIALPIKILSDVPESDAHIIKELMLNIEKIDLAAFCIRLGKLNRGDSLNQVTDGNSNRLLHLLIIQDKPLLAMQLIQTTNSIDLNLKNSIGFTPLYLAALKGNIKIVQALIDTTRVDINLPCLLGNTALHVAAQFEQRDIAKLLREAGADIYKKNGADKHAAEIAPYLIEQQSSGQRASSHHKRSLLGFFGKGHHGIRKASSNTSPDTPSNGKRSLTPRQ